MPKLIRHSELSADEFIKLLSTEQISVIEEVQGSKIWVSYSSQNGWEIRPKFVNNYPINMVDLAIQKYYKWAYAYFISLSDEVTNILKPNISYGFEYFCDESPSNIRYDRKPKNGLILTGICKFGKYYTYDQVELKVFADLFQVELLPEIYRGRLGQDQIDKIVKYVHTGMADLDLIWKEKTFAEFFYNILNPQLKHSYLKNGWQDNLEKIVIRFVGKDSEAGLEILNPMYQKMQFKTDGEFSDVYSILLFNFIQWMQTVNVKEIEVAGTTRDVIYINLMSKLYNTYMQKYFKSIESFDFSIPEFFSTDKFKMNRDMIQNRTTKEWIDKSPKFEYVFKILLSSFQRERKKVIGVINDTVLGYLNREIKGISIRVEELLNWNHQLDDFSFQQKDITKFGNIKWEQDSKGYAYPEVGSIFGDEEEHNKKKMKKGFKDGSK